MNESQPSPPSRTHKALEATWSDVGQEWQRARQEFGHLFRDLGQLGRTVLEPLVLAKGRVELFVDYPKEADLRLYKSMLSDRGVLTEPEGFSTEFLSKVQDSFIQKYGSQISKRKILNFFSRISPNSIFIIKNDQYDKVVNTWLDNVQDETSSIKQAQEEYKVIERGNYTAFSDAIFLRYSGRPEERGRLESSFCEELSHKFLAYAGAGYREKIPMLRAHGRRRWAKRHEALSGVNYWNDPEEQIVKYMSVELMKELHPAGDALFSRDYLQAAGIGARRVAEVGWRKILRGKYKTTHEEDFRFTPDNLSA